jgi:hypothetical protein
MSVSFPTQARRIAETFRVAGERSSGKMEQNLNDYYRLPKEFHSRFVHKETTNAPGFFKFGSGTFCFGRCETGSTARSPSSRLYDAIGGAYGEDHCVRVPFDAAEVVDNLRMERYLGPIRPHRTGLVGSPVIRKAYYAVREFLPVSIRRQFQRMYLRGWKKLVFPSWPVDFTVDTLHEQFLSLSMKAMKVPQVPFIWFWPDGARSCLIMTHDVETTVGVDFTSSLMDMDDSYGIKASFQVIPGGRYGVRADYLEEIRSRGFEVNVHDLKHDGSLFQDHTEFLHQAAKINESLRNFRAQGFRSGAMYRNQEWLEALDMSYDMSVPNAAHLEPQRGGCCTVMPYRIGKILELPLTMTQDYSLFHMLRDYSIDLWKAQCDQILRRSGLISFIVHPDYVVEERARNVYLNLLGYLSHLIADKGLWMALPRDVNRWWRNRSQMELVRDGDGWHIEGPDNDRARIAYATLQGDRVIYSLDEAS